MAAGTLLDLVLDEAIDSRSTPAGTLVKVHLEKPLEVGGIVLAAAGAPGNLKVVAARKADAPDHDGSLEIYLEPFPLAGHGLLPLRAVAEFLTVEAGAGRKARDLTLPAGSIVRARTGATIDATNPAAIAIIMPAPFVTNTDPIHSDFTPIPLFTFAPAPPKRPRPSPSPSPSASATPPAAS